MAEDRRDPQATVRQVETRLNAVYQRLRGAPDAVLLVQALARLKNEEYEEACELVERARGAFQRALQTLAFQRVTREADRKAIALVFDDAVASLRSLAKHQAPKPPADLPSREMPPQRSAFSGAAAGRGFSTADDADERIEDTIITMGTFSQLLLAVEQCGLPLSTQFIVDVREREFPAKRYQRSLDLLERVSVQLNAQASRRTARLRQEEQQYRAGTLKMTPREWLLKTKRDAEQSQKIERAQRYFARILDSLRKLRAPQGP